MLQTKHIGDSEYAKAMNEQLNLKVQRMGESAKGAADVFLTSQNTEHVDLLNGYLKTFGIEKYQSLIKDLENFKLG